MGAFTARAHRGVHAPPPLSTRGRLRFEQRGRPTWFPGEKRAAARSHPKVSPSLRWVDATRGREPR